MISSLKLHLNKVTDCGSAFNLALGVTVALASVGNGQRKQESSRSRQLGDEKSQLRSLRLHSYSVYAYLVAGRRTDTWQGLLA